MQASRSQDQKTIAHDNKVYNEAATRLKTDQTAKVDEAIRAAGGFKAPFAIARRNNLAKAAILSTATELMNKNPQLKATDFPLTGASALGHAWNYHNGIQGYEQPEVYNDLSETLKKNFPMR